MRAALLGLLWAVGGCALQFDESKLRDAGPDPDEDAGDPPDGLSCDCRTGNCRNPCSSQGVVAGSCSCDTSCANATCSLECQNDATCSIDCNDAECEVTAANATSLSADCHDGAECTFACSDSARCEDIRCDGAACVLDCNGAAVCAFASCSDGDLECPGGELVCGRDCP